MRTNNLTELSNQIKTTQNELIEIYSLIRSEDKKSSKKTKSSLLYKISKALDIKTNARQRIKANKSLRKSLNIRLGELNYLTSKLSNLICIISESELEETEVINTSKVNDLSERLQVISNKLKYIDLAPEMHINSEYWKLVPIETDLELYVKTIVNNIMGSSAYKKSQNITEAPESSPTALDFYLVNERAKSAQELCANTDIYWDDYLSGNISNHERRQLENGEL